MDIQTRFFQKIRHTPSGCWFWLSALSRGTPVFSIPPSKAVTAVRFAWKIVFSEPPPQGRLDRTCQTPLCVNPHHRKVFTPEERFWSLVEKTDGCWRWLGDTVAGGYGRVSRKGRLLLAHRYSYTISNGEIQNGLRVCHRCDNPPCVNPSHLFLGTDSDNQRDCVAKGRHHGRRMLTDDVVQTVRRSRLDALSLAKKYGVTRSTIYNIRSRKTWKDL